MDKYSRLKETERVLKLSKLFPKELQESIDLGICINDYISVCKCAEKFLCQNTPEEIKRFVEISIYTDVRLGYSKILPNYTLEISPDSTVYCSGLTSLDIAEAVINGEFSIRQYLLSKGD